MRDLGQLDISQCHQCMIVMDIGFGNRDQGVFGSFGVL